MSEVQYRLFLAVILHEMTGLFEYCGKNDECGSDHSSQRATEQVLKFSNKYLEYFPSVLNKVIDGEETITSLIKGCDAPETLLQWIVHEAIAISCGTTGVRRPDQIIGGDKKSNYLKPLLAELNSSELRTSFEASNDSYAYFPQKATPDSIFPVRRTDIDDGTLQGAYNLLLEDFESGLSMLMHREAALSLWFEHFDSLLQQYFSFVPARACRTGGNDTPLYDQLKTATAVCASLFLFHNEKEAVDIKEIKDPGYHEFLLVSGDFYGIQDFIFSASGDTGRYRSKLLRGRSFAVSIMSELAADMLCRKIGLPSQSVLINAAGKFTILAPNTERTRSEISLVEQRVNDWLFSISYGQSSLGISFTEAGRKDLTAPLLIKLWDAHLKDVSQKKFARIDIGKYGGAIPDYLEKFAKQDGHRLCSLCGKRPVSSSASRDRYCFHTDGRSCDVCRDHVYIGKNIVRANRVAIVHRDISVSEAKLLLPFFNDYQVVFSNASLDDYAKSGQLYKLWDLNGEIHLASNGIATAKCINGYVPCYSEADLFDQRITSGLNEEQGEELQKSVSEQHPKTFNHLAKVALNEKEISGKFEGIEALGILKADIDDLGLLMACGLSDEVITIQRLTALSRQIDSFFTSYLPSLLQKNEKYSNVYTVFAGGDDLFLIGPWNRIIEFALFLHQAFAQYACNNSDIHFSAGIVIEKTNSPIDKLAAKAEHALETAKNAGKNRLYLFGETITWERAHELAGVYSSLELWSEQYLSKGMLYKLDELIAMASTESRLLSRGGVSLEDRACCKWPSHLCYFLNRNLNKELKGERREQALREVAKLGDWLTEYRGAMKLPLWQILYNKRPAGR